MPDDVNTVAPARRIHKSTVLILLLVIVLPWALVAIPGVVSKGQMNGFKTVTGYPLKMIHGWPAIHLTSSKHNGNFSHYLARNPSYGLSRDDDSPSLQFRYFGIHDGGRKI